MLTFTNISKAYGSQQTLKDVNLTIYPQEFVLLIGPSGAGKSTLMHLLLGAQKPTTGSIQIDGTHIENLDTATMQEYRRMIGMVFQDYKLLPQKTVFENVSFAMEVCGEEDLDIEKRVNAVLEKVNLLHKSTNYPDELSGGEKQRTALARALVHKPKLLVADEPTGNLDPDSAMQMVELLKRINEEGVTVILATHNQEIVDSLKTRVIKIEDGMIVSDKISAGKVASS